MQLAGTLAKGQQANGVATDAAQGADQGRQLYLGSQELGYKREQMEASCSALCYTTLQHRATNITVEHSRADIQQSYSVLFC